MTDQPIAASLEPAERETRPPEDVALDLVAIATLAALAIGLGSLVAGRLAWDRQAALDGILSQVPETVPAAVLVLVATAANLGAGAVLARLALGRSIDGLGRALVAAFAGSVLLDASALFVLGGLGLFRAPVLIALHAAILALGWRARPILAPGWSRPRLASAGLPWAIVVVPWLGILALQLASPVVPFLDVLPNHVAPVERLRTLGEFATLTESPSPIYGPSRTFLGYVGLLGTIATMTGLPAGLAVAAFILPGSLLVAAGVHRLATAIGGGGVGLFALVAFALTASFGRMTDARATVLVLPVALGALAWLVERVDALRPIHPDGDRVRTAASRPVREALLLGAALGAAVLVHPVVGALTVATVALTAVARPQVAAVAIPAVAVASALALPQAATMLGLRVPSLLALAAALPALGLGWLLARERVGTTIVLVARGALLALVPVVLVWADSLVSGAVRGLGGLLEAMPLLVIGAVGGFVVAPRIAGHPVVLAALGAGVAVGALTQIVPGEGLLVDSIRFELPKTLHYWIPVFAALATGLGLQALFRREALGLPVRAGLVGVFLIAAAMPVRATEIDDHHLGEHRLSEALAIDLRHAGRGYWVTYPDTRRVVDGPRQALLDALRAEIEAGRANGSTSLIHVAPSFQQWVATPFGVFTGIRETVVSPDAVESIHTVGGRLRAPDRLDALLAGYEGPFEYAALEPGDGVPPDARDRLLAAGFEPLFGNAQGELFVRR